MTRTQREIINRFTKAVENLYRLVHEERALSSLDQSLKEIRK